MRFQAFSYRFAEQVLNSKLGTKREIEDIIGSIRSKGYSRPELNKLEKTGRSNHRYSRKLQTSLPRLTI